MILQIHRYAFLDHDEVMAAYCGLTGMTIRQKSQLPSIQKVPPNDLHDKLLESEYGIQKSKSDSLKALYSVLKFVLQSAAAVLFVIDTGFQTRHNESKVSCQAISSPAVIFNEAIISDIIFSAPIFFLRDETKHSYVHFFLLQVLALPFHFAVPMPDQMYPRSRTPSDVLLSVSLVTFVQ